jgi:hypothetical protein
MSPTKQNVPMVKNPSNAQLKNLLDDRPASIPTGELLPAPPEGAEFPVDPIMEEEFATAGPEFFNNNMEFGTDVNDAQEPEEEAAAPLNLRRASRTPKPTLRARESAQQESMALPLSYKMRATYFEPEIADEMADPIAFLAKTDLTLSITIRQ